MTIIMSPRTKRALERSAARNRRAISYEGAVIIERALGLDESGEIGAATVRGSRIHGESMECVPAEKGA